MTPQDFIKATGDDSNANLISKIWESDLEINEKVKLSFELDNIDYSILTSLWMYYSIAGRTRANDEQIFKKYQTILSNSKDDLSESFEYSLYFDIFEDPERNQLAWEYFLSNNPSELFLKIMLANSGPVPFDLKEILYNQLLSNESYHLDIYKSIRHSCFDNGGLVDKIIARDILYRLKLGNKIGEVDKVEHYPKYDDVVNYLK